MARSPSRKLRRVYWDSCIWISLIANETNIPLKGGGFENRVALAKAVLDNAAEGAAEIVTSALSLAEVNKLSPNPSGLADTPDKLAEFFENDYIVLAMLDRRTAELARKLMQRKLSGLRPLDAVHIATALIAKVDEMHSFDDNLIELSDSFDKLDGKPLRICKPSMGSAPLPLLEPPHESIDFPPSDAEFSEPTQEKALPSDEKNAESGPIPDSVTAPEVHGNGEDAGVRRERNEILECDPESGNPEQAGAVASMNELPAPPTSTDAPVRQSAEKE